MFKLIKNLTPKDWIFLVAAVALIVVGVQLDLKMPDYMSEITTLVETPGSEMSAILENGALMLACAFGSLATAMLTGFFIANIAASFSRNTRKQLFQKVESLSMAEVRNFSTPSLITRTTNDITQIQMFLAMGAQMLVRAPLTAFVAITKILNKSWEFSAITAVAVAVLLTVVITLVIVVLPKFKIVQQKVDRLNSVTRENLSGIRVIRAFNAEKYQENKFDHASADLMNLQLFNQRRLSVISPMMYLIMYMLPLAIYLTGASLISDIIDPYAKVSLFGDMVVFSSYAMQIIVSFLMLAITFVMLPRASVSAKRINEVLDTEVSIKNGTATEGIKGAEGRVEFRHVSFKYPDADEALLEDISFVAEKGQTVAFIGSTGSGKSTLINLIPRFYDATSGEVLVNGRNVKEYNLPDLYKTLAYVPQKAVIFNESVKNNIAFGEASAKITDKAVEQAIKVSQSAEFVSKLENQEKTKIAQGGTNISGGQKQRLSVARAIARNPEIYIFDDTFSALDFKTDAALRQALKKHTKDATSLIVAQRIGTIMHADQIIVLDEGKCVGQGKHHDLLKNCPVYRQIAESQLSKEELANA